MQNEKLRRGAAEFAAVRVRRERRERDASHTEQSGDGCKNEGVTRHRQFLRKIALWDEYIPSVAAGMRP